MLVLHQLSVSDRYFCQARQEVRLLSLSHGPCHWGLLFYRCSIKGSQRNHPAFLWLKLVCGFTSIPSLLLSSLDFSLPVFANTSERSAGVTGPGRSEGTVDSWSCYQNRFHAGTSPSQTSHLHHPRRTIGKVQRRRCWSERLNSFIGAIKLVFRPKKQMSGVNFSPHSDKKED